jgi:hypothetical protein
MVGHGDMGFIAFYGDLRGQGRAIAPTEGLDSIPGYTIGLAPFLMHNA